MFEKLGAEIEPKVLLVGLRRPKRGAGHPVCVEPEDGEWPLTLFAGLGEGVDRAISAHPLQQMFYGDERTLHEKPTRIRQQTISEEVQRLLRDEDRRLGRRSFCSEAYPIDDYDVVCVFQLPSRLFDQFPSIDVSWNSEPYETSLVRSCVRRLLEEGRRGLAAPEPGRSNYDEGMRSAEEIIRLAGTVKASLAAFPAQLGAQIAFPTPQCCSHLQLESFVGLLEAASPTPAPQTAN